MEALTALADTSTTQPEQLVVVPPSAPSSLSADEWDRVVHLTRKRLSDLRHAIAEPVKVVDEDVRIREYAMIAERPYLVEYKGELYEFVRKVDGSIVVSEIRIG
jgi:hypothetical protein